MVEKIKLTFLGTGSAIPTARRNHPSFYLQYKNENILVDCGEGTQRQFRKAGLNPCKITRILITHWHGDHVLGLPGLFKTLMLNEYNKELEIYGPKGTKRRVEMYLDLFAHKGAKIFLNVHEVEEGIFFENEEFYLESYPMKHDVLCVAYSFVLKERKRVDKSKLKNLKIGNSPLIGELARGKVVEIKGKKVDGRKLIYVEPQKKISFVMDTQMNDNAIKISKGADLLICESTYSKEDKEVAKERAHLMSIDAGKIAKKARVKKLVLTHLSQRYDEIPKIILNEAKEVFENVSVAEDLDKEEF
ncbi:MAG: ribonuclease Z [Candidatus Pacearchaeota archaeon]